MATVGVSPIPPGQVGRPLCFFRWFGKPRSQALQFVCSDLWQPYLKVVAKKAGQALHVLDRFHIRMHFSKAIDEIRAQEAKQLKQNGYEPILTRTRWLLLKRPENLGDASFEDGVDSRRGFYLERPRGLPGQAWEERAKGRAP